MKRYYIKYTKGDVTATVCTSYSTKREAEIVSEMLTRHGYTIDIEERDVLVDGPIADYYHQKYKENH